MVSEQKIVVPPDSTGKGLRVTEVTTAAGTVEQQVVNVGDPTTAGNLATVGAGGDQLVSITNPTAAQAGIYASVSPFGSLNVTTDNPPIFWDEFDSSIDSNRWVLTGTVNAVSTGTNLSLSVSTTASATSVATSSPSFPTPGPMTFGCLATVETAVTLGNHRFWGFGQISVAPGTSAAPLTNAIGFELDTAGALRASVYSGGTRVFTQVITTSIRDGISHRYGCITRADTTFWFVDDLDAPVAFTQTGSGMQGLPVRIASLNSASVTVGTPTLSVSALAVYDEARQAEGIADGTYPWRKAVVGPGGDLRASVTSPAASLAGIYGLFQPYGSQRVSVEATPQFYDPFDGSSINGTMWSTAGTQVPTQAAGQLTVAATVGASVANNSTLISKPTFLAPGIGFSLFGCVVTLEAAQVNAVQVHRFWGKGQVTSYAFGTPVTDGYGFEVEGATGNLQCVVYIAGTKYVLNSSLASLISSSVAGAGGSGTALPTGISGSNYGSLLTWKGGPHRYAIFARADIIYWYIEGVEVPVAVLSYGAPQVQALPVRFASITNSAATSLAHTFQVSAVTVADSTAQNHTVSDPTYPWRRAGVTRDNGLIVSLNDGNKATYTSGLSAQANTFAGDIWMLRGSASTVIRVLSLTVVCSMGAATSSRLTITKRTGFTGGTAAGAPTVASHDSGDSAATATSGSFSAAGTAGSTVTILDAAPFVTSASNLIVGYTKEWGRRGGKGVVLRGTNEYVVIANGTTIGTSGSWSIICEFTEDFLS